MASPSIGFIVVNRIGEASAPMTASAFLQRGERGIGFWRVRVKPKNEHENPACPPAPGRQGGDLSSSSPAALAHPIPSAPLTPEPKDAPEPVLDSNLAGSGAKQQLSRNQKIVELYQSGIPLYAIAERLKLSHERVRQIVRAAERRKTKNGDGCSQQSGPVPRKTQPTVSAPVKKCEQPTPLATAGAGERIATAPQPATEKPKFRSWVEDYQKPEERFDPDAVKAAMLRRRDPNFISVVSKNTKAYATIAANIAEAKAKDEHRRTDRFERAKSFLQKRGPVFSATYRGGEIGQWFVDGQRGFLTNDEVIALAQRKGWVE